MGQAGATAILFSSMHPQVQQTAETLFSTETGHSLVNMCSYNPAVSLPCNGSLVLFIFVVCGVAELTVRESTTVRLFKFFVFWRVVQGTLCTQGKSHSYSIKLHTGHVLP